MNSRFKGIKKNFLSLVSAIGLFLIVWTVFFGKAKAVAWLAPLLNKIPKDESALSKLTEKVLGEAVKQVNSENIKNVTEKGSEFFENSEYAQPAREIRENVKARVNEVVESIKDLPAQEVKLIKRQVCKEWMEEDGASSVTGSPEQ